MPAATFLASLSRGSGGGGYGSGAVALQAAFRYFSAATAEYQDIGFRVAEVSEQAPTCGDGTTDPDEECDGITFVPDAGGSCADDTDCYDGDECTVNTCNAGTCESTPVVHLYGDIQPAPNPAASFPCDAEERSRMGDGFLTMLDVMCAFNAMNDGSPHANCPCADVQPCGGDNFLTMLDVMYIFNTMNSPPGACADPC